MFTVAVLGTGSENISYQVSSDAQLNVLANQLSSEFIVHVKKMLRGDYLKPTSFLFHCSIV